MPPNNGVNNFICFTFSEYTSGRKSSLLLSDVEVVTVCDPLGEPGVSRGKIYTTKERFQRNL